LKESEGRVNLMRAEMEALTLKVEKLRKEVGKMEKN